MPTTESPAAPARQPSVFLLAAVLFLLPHALAAQSGASSATSTKSATSGEKSEKASATTKLRIEVSGGEKEVPVDSASVYVKYQQERTLAKDKKVEMNVKTNRHGVVTVPGVPRGKVLIQVIAPGWKTFGQWYDLEKEEQTIKINLQKPPRWY